MKIPQSILDVWKGLQQRTQTLQTLRDRLHRAKTDAEQHFATNYLANEAFVANDELHKRKVLSGIETRNLKQRQSATAVALFAVERELPAFEPDLSGFRATARRAQHPIDAWMAVSGGDRKFLKDSDELLAEVAHEQRMTRLLLETPDWQPSRWHREYECAKDELSDPVTVRAAASFLMFAESKHGAGWSGPTPASLDEEAAAVNLRRLIASTQQARIPAELAEIEAGVEDLKKVAGRARTLDHIMPINPQSDPAAKAIFEVELAEEEAATMEVA